MSSAATAARSILKSSMPRQLSPGMQVQVVADGDGPEREAQVVDQAEHGGQAERPVAEPEPEVQQDGDPAQRGWRTNALFRVSLASWLSNTSSRSGSGRRRTTASSRSRIFCERLDVLSAASSGFGAGELAERRVLRDVHGHLRVRGRRLGVAAGVSCTVARLRAAPSDTRGRSTPERRHATCRLSRYRLAGRLVSGRSMRPSASRQFVPVAGRSCSMWVGHDRPGHERLARPCREAAGRGWPGPVPVAVSVVRMVKYRLLPSA